MPHSTNYLRIRELLLVSNHKKAIAILIEHLPEDVNEQAEIVNLSARYNRYLNSGINNDKDPQGLDMELNRITASVLQLAEKYVQGEVSRRDNKAIEELYRLSAARAAVGRLLVQDYLQGSYRNTTGHVKSSGVSRRLVIKVYKELEAAEFANKTYKSGKACYVLTDLGKKLLAFLEH